MANVTDFSLIWQWILQVIKSGCYWDDMSDISLAALQLYMYFKTHMICILPEIQITVTIKGYKFWITGIMKNKSLNKVFLNCDYRYEAEKHNDTSWHVYLKDVA